MKKKKKKLTAGVCCGNCKVWIRSNIILHMDCLDLEVVCGGRSKTIHRTGCAHRFWCTGRLLVANITWSADWKQWDYKFYIHAGNKKSCHNLLQSQSTHVQQTCSSYSSNNYNPGKFFLQPCHQFIAILQYQYNNYIIVGLQ